ncbi:MAG: hypothetical protein FWF46_05795 [Oscillospiraceae bacterium]|nr:hypothetical protein [Oscillospiraceae bacterium]
MKKNVIVTVLMIIIFVLGVALGGVCMMLYNNNKDKNDTSQLNNNTYNNGNDIANIGDNQANNVGNNAFAVYQQNYNKRFGDLVDDQGYNYTISIHAYNAPGDSLGIYDAYVDNHGDAYIDISKTSNLYSKYGANYKVASNVADVTFCHYGNGSDYYLVLLNQDGTVSFIHAGSLEVEISELRVINIPDLKNIVKIQSETWDDYDGTGSWIGCAVDINGNVIDLDQYLENDTTQYQYENYLDSYYNARDKYDALFQDLM